MADVESSPGGGGKPLAKEDPGKRRFLLELEFVQFLANPTYIHYLAQNRYFEDEAFIGYLKYLKYRQRPEYIKFIMYPHCLSFLSSSKMRISRMQWHIQQARRLLTGSNISSGKKYRNNRMKHILPRPPEPTPVPAPTQAPATVPPPAPVPTPVVTCSCTANIFATCGSGWCICDVSYAVCRNSWHQYPEE